MGRETIGCSGLKSGTMSLRYSKLGIFLSLTEETQEVRILTS